MHYNCSSQHEQSSLVFLLRYIALIINKQTKNSNITQITLQVYETVSRIKRTLNFVFLLLVLEVTKLEIEAQR